MILRVVNIIQISIIGGGMTSGSEQPKMYVVQEVRENFQPQKHQAIRAW